MNTTTGYGERLERLEALKEKWKGKPDFWDEVFLISVIEEYLEAIRGDEELICTLRDEKNAMIDRTSMLRSTIDKQKKQIEELKAEIEKLKADPYVRRCYECGEMSVSPYGAMILGRSQRFEKALKQIKGLTDDVEFDLYGPTTPLPSVCEAIDIAEEALAEVQL